MRLIIVAFLLLLCLPSKPGSLHGKLVVDKVDVKDVYPVYNASLMGEDCNVVMFAEACYTRGYNPNHLSRVVEHESGYNLTARNRHSGASGLIQFMPSTAKGLGTSVSRIRTMSFEQQLNLTMYYLDITERDFGFINDSIDMYLAVFWPKGIIDRDNGRSVFIRAGTPAYNLNRDNDRDKDGDIDEWDIGSIMRYSSAKIDTISVLKEVRFVSRIKEREFNNELGL